MGLIVLVADGSCLSQHGAGGWAYRFEYRGKVYKDAQGVYPTTNNQTEIMAVIEGFKKISKVAGKEVRVLVISDSRYVIRGYSEWLEGWKRRRWITASGTPVSNKELWEALDLVAEPFQTQWKWVKGHAGHELNEIVDEMANDAARAIARRRSRLLDARPATA